MDKQEIKNSIYTGICIYKKLRNTILKIGDDIVTLEDKKDLALYLGIINTDNSISKLLQGTDLKLNAQVTFKNLDNEEVENLYSYYIKSHLINFNLDNIYTFFDNLLDTNIVKKLNKQYNFTLDSIQYKNKQLIKK